MPFSISHNLIYTIWAVTAAVHQIKGKAQASASWARLIHKIFKEDLLLCPNCGKEMKIIAFITNHQEVKKILKHIGEETQRAPPLPSITPYETDD